VALVGDFSRNFAGPFDKARFRWRSESGSQSCSHSTRLRPRFERDRGDFVAAWHLWGPQYFIKLRVDEKNLALRYHWSKQETVIPLKEVTKLSIVRSESRRSSRLAIETTGGTFRSFGFGRLDEDQVTVLDAIRQKIAAVETPQQAK
jgi:hypothetical protein